MSSAVEFVEGGVQDACEDACSICLETFSDQDPASVTDCNHEYHLQCILEWSQRSTECPMCWQALRLQDASSQELLASMEQERSLRQNRIQASSLPRLRSGDYEFHQFSESFEERLMQHFAAAVGHSHGLGRGSHRPSVAGQHPSQFLIFPTYSTAASSGMAGHDDSASVRSVIGSSIPSEQGETGTSYAQQHNASAERHGDINTQSHSARQRTSSESASTSQFGASTSDLQSFSDTIRSRLAAVSSRYKESLTKTTRIFRERLRVRNGTAPDINVGAPEENPSYTGGGTAGQSGDTSEPFVHLTAEIAEATSTDIIPVHIANVEKNEDNVSPRDPGAIDASSQPVTNEVAGAVQDVTVFIHMASIGGILLKERKDHECNLCGKGGYFFSRCYKKKTSPSKENQSKGAEVKDGASSSKCKYKKDKSKERCFLCRKVNEAWSLTRTCKICLQESITTHVNFFEIFHLEVHYLIQDAKIDVTFMKVT